MMDECKCMMLVIWSEVGPAGGMFEIVSNYFILFILKVFLFFSFLLIFHASILCLIIDPSLIGDIVNCSKNVVMG